MPHSVVSSNNGHHDGSRDKLPPNSQVMAQLACATVEENILLCLLDTVIPPAL